MEKTDDASATYIVDGTREEISELLTETPEFSLNKEEATILTSLEIDKVSNHVSSKEEAGFWLYDDERPATLLVGKSKYSIEVTKASRDIIKKIFKFAATHVNPEEAGLALTPVDKVLFIYDILSVIYKHLYKLKDYEWCFCFSAASYLKQNKQTHFSPKDVLNALYQDSEHLCKHIGDHNDCNFHASNDYCRLNNNNVGDVIKHLLDNKVIEPFTYDYYSFVH